MSVALGLSPRDRRALVLGAGTVVGLVLVARGGPALRAWESGRLSEARSTTRQLLAVRNGIVAQPALRDSLAARRRRLAALDSATPRGSSPAALGAAVAAAVEEIADDNSIKVVALQLRSDSAAVDSQAGAEVRVSGVADIVGLAAFLQAVEGGATPLLVKELSVSQSAPAADSTKPEALRIDVLIAANGSVDRARAATGARPAMLPGASVTTMRTTADAAVESAENATVSNDAFRLANEPAAVRYDPNDDARASRAAMAPPPAPIRPTMTLKAIVGGPPWQAVVDGLPGRPPGTIVRVGASFDRLVARRVTRDSVFIQGPDTSWVLTFQRRP